MAGRKKSLTPDELTELRRVVREMKNTVHSGMVELQRRQEERRRELERQRARLRRMTFGLRGR